MKLLLVVLCVLIVAASAKVIIIDHDYDNYNGIEGGHKASKPASAVVTQNLYIPMTLKECDSASCQAACEALGYPNGICVSPTTCDCY